MAWSVLIDDVNITSSIAGFHYKPRLETSRGILRIPRRELATLLTTFLENEVADFNADELAGEVFNDEDTRIRTALESARATGCRDADALAVIVTSWPWSLDVGNLIFNQPATPRPHRWVLCFNTAAIIVDTDIAEFNISIYDNQKLR